MYYRANNKQFPIGGPRWDRGYIPAYPLKAVSAEVSGQIHGIVIEDTVMFDATQPQTP